MQTYLFYDVETTGLNKAFDQVLQFAAIRTDTAFNEIDRLELAIRLRPDVIISPRAIITHRIPVDKTLQGLPEYEATAQIHQWMNAARTTSLGYNTLGFDDEFLRFSFHRNLLPPYTHQYANGCRRMDILPITVIYKVYSQDTLVWPEVDGKPTLKLEYLNEANGLSTGRAHEAMVDVEATVALARKLSEKTKIWDFITGYFDKGADGERISELPVAFESDGERFRKGIVISHDMGAENAYQAPVLSIGKSIPYSNQTLWLRLDQPELQKTSSDTVDDTTWVIRKRIGEPPFILPPHDRYQQRLSESSRKLAEDNLAWLSSHPDLLRDIIHYHQQFRYPDIPDLDPDAVLYQMGFLSREEESQCRRFHKAPLHDKPRLAGEFSNSEIRTLARRILMRNYPDAGSKIDKSDWLQYMDRVNPRKSEDALLDYRGEKRTTPLGALAEIDLIRREENVDDEQQRLLEDLESYLKTNFNISTTESSARQSSNQSA